MGYKTLKVEHQIIFFYFFIIFFIVWSLWNGRNDFLFKNKRIDCQKIWDIHLMIIIWWIKGNWKDCSYDDNQFITNFCKINIKSQASKLNLQRGHHLLWECWNSLLMGRLKGIMVPMKQVVFVETQIRRYWATYQRMQVLCGLTKRRSKQFYMFSCSANSFSIVTWSSKATRLQ